jgi:acetylornithine deacetylase
MAIRRETRDHTMTARLSPLEDSVLSALDEEALVRDLVRLVRVPSITGTDAESELMGVIARDCAALDVDVDHWRVDLNTIAVHPDFPGTEAPRTEAWGLVATTTVGEGTPALVLQGHVDVVPTGHLARWEGVDPFGAMINEGVLHGRGACDMKAGVAANTAVLRTLRATGVRLEKPLAVHWVVSEEDGGLGALATLLRGHGGDAAVISEPTSGTIVIANAGALTFRIEIAGAAAHGSIRTEGVSALDAFLPVHQALAALEADRNLDRDPLFGANRLPYPLSIGMIRAGDWASTVPDELVAEGRLGVRLDEDPQAARLALEHAVAEAAATDPWLRDHPPEVTWPGGQFASGRTPAGHPLIAQMRSAVAAVRGDVPPLAAAPYGSDLRLYAGVGGIPTLHYGPGDVRLAHTPREQVRIDELIAVTRALLVLALRQCDAHR